MAELIIKFEEGKESSESSDSNETELESLDDEMDGIQVLEEETNNNQH